MAALNRQDRTTENIQAALVPSFATASRDARYVYGGVYARVVELGTLAWILKLLENPRRRRVREKRGTAAIMASFAKRSQVTNTVYLRPSGGLLIDRIDTDEVVGA